MKNVTIMMPRPLMIAMALSLAPCATNAAPPPATSPASTAPKEPAAPSGRASLPDFPDLGCFARNASSSLGACLIGFDEDEFNGSRLKATLVFLPLAQGGPQRPPIELLSAPPPQDYGAGSVQIPWPADKAKLAAQALRDFVAWQPAGSAGLSQSDGWFKKTMDPKAKFPLADSQTFNVGDAVVSLEGRETKSEDEDVGPRRDAKLTVKWAQPASKEATVISFRGEALWQFDVNVYKAKPSDPGFVFDLVVGRGHFGPRAREAMVGSCDAASGCRVVRP